MTKNVERLEKRMVELPVTLTWCTIFLSSTALYWETYFAIAGGTPPDAPMINMFWKGNVSPTSPYPVVVNNLLNINR